MTWWQRPAGLAWLTSLFSLVPALSPEAAEKSGARADAFSTITSNSRSDILSSFLEGLLHNAYHGSCEFQVAGFENLSHRIALYLGTASAVPNSAEQKTRALAPAKYAL